VSFEDKIQAASKANKSRIVLALDLEDSNRSLLFRRSQEILRNVSKYICAVKINRQLVLSLGLHDGVDSIVSMAHDLSLPAIMDAKLNDVGHTNEFMTRSYNAAGFDGIIASPIVGWVGGLDSVFQVMHSQNKAVILLVYMSNPGAEGVYSLRAAPGDGKPKPIFEFLTEMALQWKANGVVVGATRPEIIARVRELVGRRISIFSPGVGAQGGDPRQAVDAGSDYLIVGRSIYLESDPSSAARHYRDLTM
jgi:orotidine-5'-phosphate decarboxylase